MSSFLFNTIREKHDKKLNFTLKKTFSTIIVWIYN